MRQIDYYGKAIEKWKKEQSINHILRRIDW